MRHALPALALAMLACAPHAADGARVERARWLMGTTCTIEAEAADSVRALGGIEAALDTLARLEDLATRWRDSELTRLDAGAVARPVPLSRDLAAMVGAALEAAAATGGAFDPTVEPLTRAWDLRGAGRVPTAAALARARARTGWRQVAFDRAAGTLQFARAGMGLDLGGIAKGFALDRAAEVLAARGATRARLNLGGELRVLGAPAHALAIADPVHRLRPALTLRLARGALSTSAQSERGFVRRGVRYGHVLDPRTGRPVATRAAVSVIAADGTRADALSTALLVMGRAAAARFAAAHPELGVVWLEPAARGVRAWRWHVSDLSPAPGVPVAWMNDDSLAERTAR